MLITSFLFERDGAFLDMEQMSAETFAQMFGYKFPVNDYSAIHIKEGRVSFSDPDVACQWLCGHRIDDDMSGDEWERLLDALYEGYKEE